MYRQTCSGGPRSGFSIYEENFPRRPWKSALAAGMHQQSDKW
jgi:hypothetical protein